MKLDLTDKKILNIIQSHFPVVTEPYKELASMLGIDQEEVLARIKSMMDQGIIRRLGGIYESRRLGYTGTLCAMQVPVDRIDEVSLAVNSYHGVTHNYLREHSYNMWFTLLAPSQEDLAKTLEDIKNKTGITEILSMPAVKLFKVKVNFKLAEG